MPKEQALEVLSKTSYQLTENRAWSAEHKPLSLWYFRVPEHQPFAGVIKGGVSIFCDKLKKGHELLSSRGVLIGPIQDGGDMQFF